MAATFMILPKLEPCLVGIRVACCDDGCERHTRMRLWHALPRAHGRVCAPAPPPPQRKRNPALPWDLQWGHTCDSPPQSCMVLMVLHAVMQPCTPGSSASPAAPSAPPGPSGRPEPVVASVNSLQRQMGLAGRPSAIRAVPTVPMSSEAGSSGSGSGIFLNATPYGRQKQQVSSREV